jgi:hypothetical protein
MSKDLPNFHFTVDLPNFHFTVDGETKFEFGLQIWDGRKYGLLCLIGPSTGYALGRPTTKDQERCMSIFLENLTEIVSPEILIKVMEKTLADIESE